MPWSGTVDGLKQYAPEWARKHTEYKDLIFVLEHVGFYKTDVWLFPGVLEGLGSSGRLVGTISTYLGTYKCPWYTWVDE